MYAIILGIYADNYEECKRAICNSYTTIITFHLFKLGIPALHRTRVTWILKVHFTVHTIHI